jgi:RNA polymerase sigma-70 factor, ECF subfamily
MNKAVSQEPLCEADETSPCACDRDQTHSQWVATVFDANHAKLANYATSLLRGDREAAVDAVQETFFRLCKQPREAVAHYIQPWLFRTCRNYIFDQQRHRQKMSTTSDTMLLADARSDADPASRLSHHDEFQRCVSAIQLLPNSQQEVLELRISHGMSYKQIAEVTGMTVTHVGVTLHQAIRRLRTTLAT